MRLVHDERGIILSWIIKLLLGIALFGIALFEAGAIIVARVSVDGVAIDAAQEAGQEYERTGSSSKARTVAEDIADRNSAEVVEFEVLGRGERVLVTVERDAPTLFAHQIPGLKSYTVARATNSAPVR